MKRGKSFFIKQSAVFMIFLILTLPFVSALSITKITVAGSDGIENIMSSDNDYFTATVQTSEEVDASQLQISYTKEEAFDQCSGTTCTYTSSKTDRTGQEIPYTIQLIEKSIVADEVTGTVLIDEDEPEITEYAVEKSRDDITISYDIEDSACDDCTGCAGIDYLSIQEDGTEIQQINAASECFLEDELATSVSELNLQDGDHELCIIAYDNVGHESDEACEAVSVDSEAPHFETNSLQIIDAISGSKIMYIGSDAVLAKIIINVTDSSLEPSLVTADLSALNSVIGGNYKNISATCEQENETKYICTWSNIYIEDASGAIKLSFFAVDTETNEAVYSPSYTLTKDNTAPSVVQVYNEMQTDEVVLKSGLNSVYADIDPTGSAMSFDKAYLTFSLASLNKMKATSCWENGAYWTCLWNFTMSYSGASSSTLYIDAEDDAGNAMEQYDVDVETDSEEPEITSITASLRCPTASDSFIVEVNATDDSDELYVLFYGEDVRTSNEPIEEECSEIEEGKFNCLITVNDLVSYPEDEDVKIEVKDKAGNVAEDELDVSVCELENTGTPNLVTIYIDDVSPVDKLTLSYIDYPLYVPMTFSMASGAHIVSKTASCEDAAMYFIDQSEKETLAVVTIPKQQVANGTYSLGIDCTLSLTMQYGDNVYVKPEQENVTIEVELYGTPLGSIEESIAQKIEWQKIGIREAQERIDNWVWVNRIWGILCVIHSLLVKANILMSVLHWVGVSLLTTAATSTTGSAINEFTTKYDSFILKWIHFPGYGLGIGTGSLLKWLCIIYSGKLCEGFDGLENKLAVSADEYGTPAYYDQYVNGELNKQQEHAENLGGWLTWFYDWDPYKSIHTAANCLYVDAIIYNLRKERQINCMYTKCLEENTKIGLPADICDIQFKERECLYVDGAAWMAAGWGDFISFVQLTLNTALSNLDWWLYSETYYGMCSFYILLEGPTSITGKLFEKLDWSSAVWEEGTLYALPGIQAYYATCQTTGTAVSLIEEGLNPFDIKLDFQANLEGTDYCVGYE